VNAAGDRNALLLKIDQFLKVGVEFAAWPNGGWWPIALDKLAFGISQTSESRPGVSSKKNQYPPSDSNREPPLSE
jgi:hypothetical protein